MHYHIGVCEPAIIDWKNENFFIFMEDCHGLKNQASQRHVYLDSRLRGNDKPRVTSHESRVASIGHFWFKIGDFDCDKGVFE